MCHSHFHLFSQRECTFRKTNFLATTFLQEQISFQKRYVVPGSKQEVTKMFAFVNVVRKHEDVPINLLDMDKTAFIK